MLHAACDGPVIVWTQTVWTSWKDDRSGNGNGLNWSERREKHHFFPSKRNKEQTRHVLVGTIYFPLMLVAIRNLVELVRSRRRLGGVSYTPVEGPRLFQWRTREKVLGGTKSGCVLSAAPRSFSSSEFRIKRCTVLRFRMWLQRLVV